MRRWEVYETTSLLPLAGRHDSEVKPAEYKAQVEFDIRYIDTEDASTPYRGDSVCASPHSTDLLAAGLLIYKKPVLLEHACNACGSRPRS